jgi:hypothetical protein
MRLDPVGLEYTIVAVTCFFAQQSGAVKRRSGTRVSPPRACLRRIRCSEVDLRRPGAGLGRGDLPKGAVRTGRVVVAEVVGQHPAQVALI